MKTLELSILKGMETSAQARFRRILLAFGLTSLLGFVSSGLYLRYSVRPQFGEDLAHRMMAKSNHLYLLFISLLIMIAAQVRVSTGWPWLGRVVNTGRLALVVAAILLGTAMFTDHSGNFQDRQFTHYGCYLALAGTLMACAQIFERPPQ